MANKAHVKLPNGQMVSATYRNDHSDAAFVRVNGVTVSGVVDWDFNKMVTMFKPTGLNASLVR